MSTTNKRYTLKVFYPMNTLSIFNFSTLQWAEDWIERSEYEVPLVLIDNSTGTIIRTHNPRPTRWWNRTLDVTYDCHGDFILGTKLRLSEMKEKGHVIQRVLDNNSARDWEGTYIHRYWLAQYESND